MALTVSVKVRNKKIMDKLNRLVHDQATMTACHNLLYKMCDPYVPFDTGTLAQTVEITDQHVRYTQPYAHYMYEGIVYGPNIPIIQNGVVVGYFSRPGIKKTPSGSYINYDKSHHPLAGSHWDKLMLQAEQKSFEEGIEKILKARANKV